MEYVAAVHLVLRGKLEDKLKWSFKVYDRDGNGRLDKREVKHIVKVRYFTFTVACLKVTMQLLMRLLYKDKIKIIILSTECVCMALCYY